jgi:hypothetical protein
MESLLLLQLHPSSGLLPLTTAERLFTPSQSAVQSTILFFGVSMRVRIVADNHGASKGIHRALTCRFRAIFTQIEQQSTTPLLLSAVFR